MQHHDWSVASAVMEALLPYAKDQCAKECWIGVWLARDSGSVMPTSYQGDRMVSS